MKQKKTNVKKVMNNLGKIARDGRTGGLSVTISEMDNTLFYVKGRGQERYTTLRLEDDGTGLIGDTFLFKLDMDVQKPFNSLRVAMSRSGFITGIDTPNSGTSGKTSAKGSLKALAAQNKAAKAAKAEKKAKAENKNNKK